MNIQAKITLLIGRDGTTIEVMDDAASTTFLRIQLTPEQLSAALSRQAHTECQSCIIVWLERVGKKMELKKDFTFTMPGCTYNDRVVMARDACAKELSRLGLDKEGWMPDESFNSQSSFKEAKGITYASTILRRWI